MTPVRSRRLFGPTVLGNTNTTLYTVPADRTVRVQPGGLRLVNYSAAARNVFLFINGTTGTSGVLRILGVGVDVTYIDLGEWCLDPGDVFSGQASANSSIAVTMMGSLLDGAPS